MTVLAVFTVGFLRFWRVPWPPFACKIKDQEATTTVLTVSEVTIGDKIITCRCFCLGEVFSVIITGNFTAYKSWWNQLMQCNAWCCSSREKPWTIGLQLLLVLCGVATQSRFLQDFRCRNAMCNIFVSIGMAPLIGKIEWGVFGRGFWNNRFVLKPDVAIASEVSILSKNSLVITDFHAKKTQHTPLF